MATVVHTNADGTTHVHGPSSAKIVALGTVTLGGATFMVDRDGQISAGGITEFGKCLGFGTVVAAYSCLRISAARTHAVRCVSEKCISRIALSLIACN